MKIAIDAAAAAEVPAGRGRYVRELIRALAAREDDHEYLLFARERWQEVELDGRFDWRLMKLPGPAWALAAGAQMSRAADVALGCNSYAIAIPWRIPGAIVIYDFAPFQPALNPPVGSQFERLTLPLGLRRAKAAIAISQATREELRCRFPRSQLPVAVAGPAADPSFTAQPDAGDAAALARHGIRTPYVLAIGTLEPRKNLPRLIEAFAGLDDRVASGWKLVLAGARGWQTDETFAAVQAHEDLVQTLGYVPEEDLPALYRGAGVVAYPSLYEGFGIPVLEGMQSGTAVLTSNLSSMPEVGGEAARYVDPTDVAAIRDGLLELISDEAVRARRARLGPERARSFSWEETAATILGVLEGLAGR